MVGFKMSVVSGGRLGETSQFTTAKSQKPAALEKLVGFETCLDKTSQQNHTSLQGMLVGYN